MIAICRTYSWEHGTRTILEPACSAVPRGREVGKWARIKYGGVNGGAEPDHEGVPVSESDAPAPTQQH